MCGIAGIIDLAGRPAEPLLLRRMGEALWHRGPDEEGLYVDGSVGFHHRRLAIIDLASGRQPMSAGGVTGVLNGEIYNYLELREELVRRGHRFETASDTEVLLRMYLEHGPACVERLNGMFAFVIHDPRCRRVVAARDHFGIKPLYWTRVDERLLFASEIKALLRHPGVPRHPDYDALRDYLAFQFVLGERTLFRGVTKQPPGTYRVIGLDDGRVETVRYWEPRFVIDRFHTEEYFVTELRRLLEDSIRLQLRSDVPVGTYLSGGMDSSIVTLLAARQLGPGLASFTGAFDAGPAFDERSYAREVAAAAGAEVVEIVPTEDDFVSLLPRLVYHMDEPAAGPGLFPQFMVSREAARRVKVCLGGQGGDEMFGGYARYLVAYLEQALKGAIHETNEEAEHIVSLKSIIPHLASLRDYVPMLKSFWQAELFEPMDRRYFRLLDRSGGARELLSEDFRACYREDELFARFQGVFNHPDTRSYYNKMTHFDLVAGLPALLQVEDRVSMASSLESRVPLLDPRIADLVASMPPRMKFRGGELKYILKRATQGLLPRRVAERKEKMGFPVPLHLWARGRCREFIRDLLDSRACRERGLFDSAALARAVDDEQAFGRRLWGILNVELWHQVFIDRA